MIAQKTETEYGNEANKPIPLVTVEYDVLETITILRLKRIKRDLPQGWTERDKLENTKEYVRTHSRDLTWEVLQEERKYHYWPAGEFRNHDRSTKPRRADDITQHVFAGGRRTTPPNGRGNGVAGVYDTDRIGILAERPYPGGSEPNPLDHSGHTHCSDGGWNGEGPATEVKPSSSSEEIHNRGLSNMSGGRQEVQVAEAASAVGVQHDAGGVPSEVGPAEGLPNDGTGILHSEVSAGESLGAGAETEAGTNSDSEGTEGEGPSSGTDSEVAGGDKGGEGESGEEGSATTR